jgi:signal transduction histidine kinase
LNLAGSGIEVLDLLTDAGFAKRSLHHDNFAAQGEGMLRLGRSFLDSPDSLLQELVNAAVLLCGADSAGISIARESSEAEYYEWVATAGEYSHFLSAMLPKAPSACGVCLERGVTQLFRVHQNFFDDMQIDAPVVTYGILLPWHVGELRGTIWITAHGRDEAFDLYDLRTMELLADFTSMGVRQIRQQKALLDQTAKTAAVEAAWALSNKLAHEINNPLQKLANVLYLAEKTEHLREAKALTVEASTQLRRVSATVTSVLTMSSIRRRLHTDTDDFPIS